MSDHGLEAQKWLGYLRNGTDMYEDYIDYLRSEVKKGGLTLQDIGTSEEELKELRIKNMKKS